MQQCRGGQSPGIYDEAPTHEFYDRLEMVKDDDGGLLARSDVVTRSEKGDAADEIKELRKFG